MRLRSWGLAGLAVVAAAATGCRRGTPPIAASADLPVVAEVDGVRIGAGAVTSTMRRRGIGPREALDEVVAFELLARAAAESGVALDEEDRRAARAAMVQRLIERELEPQLGESAIDDGEVRALYERGKKRFVHGRLVQSAILCVFTGARMKPEPRARAEATARELAAFVAARGDGADFERIAQDQAWSGRNVSFTTVWQDTDEPFPRVVGDAVQALRRPGQMTALVGDETGYYLARYLAERPPENVSYEAAAPRLRAEMFEPWRRQKFLRLALDLAGPHGIEVFPDHFPLLAPPSGQ